MYGVKFEQDTIQIKESNKSDLEALGYEVFKTRDDAETRGINLEYRALRREFNAMTLTELNSERAKELEKRIWGRHANYDGCDYVPGENIERQKKLCSKCRAFLLYWISRCYNRKIQITWILFKTNHCFLTCKSTIFPVVLH